MNLFPRLFATKVQLAFHPMYQVALFDSSKGNEEGKEIEKVIAWYPSDCTEREKIQSVGLLQALIQFAGVFDEVRYVFLTNSLVS